MQFLYQIHVKKCASSIGCCDSNPRPSEHESPPITTRPGLNFKYLVVHFKDPVRYKWTCQQEEHGCCKKQVGTPYALDILYRAKENIGEPAIRIAFKASLSKKDHLRRVQKSSPKFPSDPGVKIRCIVCPTFLYLHTQE